MKVMKFGGTSVGSAESILNVKKIVEAEKMPVIVVVSALGGITDQLIAASKLAVYGDVRYLDLYKEMVERHHKLIDEVIKDVDTQIVVLKVVDKLLKELKSIYQGVFLIRDLSDKTLGAIVSYGERMSSQIVANLIKGALWYDSLKFIKTEKRRGKNILVTDETNALIKSELSGVNRAVVPGFIATDIHSGEITNLGRGGSDYTASIIAAALNVKSLEIWTDADGFMTADPRVINTAHTIESLSYLEAMELSNFGAKVVYPPTIYPVYQKNIPIYIKNTFNPTAKGSVIEKSPVSDKTHAIKGISSINNNTLITVSGISMVGIIGVNQRIFTALAAEGISVFLVSQASSETSTSIGVKNEDAERACDVLNQEFAKEIEMGSMFKMHKEKNLATIAIVGENMKHTPGIAGKLFGMMGRNGVNVIACVQGASETNISFVVESGSLKKAMGIIHEGFFSTDKQAVNVIVCGTGTVGGALLSQIESQKAFIERDKGLIINVVGVANGHNALFDSSGVALADISECLKKAPESDLERLRSEVLEMKAYNKVFVDCTANASVAGLYKDFLERGISVVAANKIAASSYYENYKSLKQTALEHNAKFLYEANVGAGLPIIKTINDLVASGDKILKIEAVLSGTLNYIFNTLSASIPFSLAVQQAKAQGYSEPDPRVDLSGTDVVRKLVILARESGYAIDVEDVEKQGFIPEEFFSLSIDGFWKKLPYVDASFESQRAALDSDNKRLRFVASFNAASGAPSGVTAKVGLEAVGASHPFYDLEGSNNIILLTTERYKAYPMRIQGYGAGADVTAAGVFGDILKAAK